MTPRLGPLSLGASYALYFFMQYLCTPIAWWAAQHTPSLSWMNDIFILFDLQGLDPFTQRSVVYSLYGLAAFSVGYVATSARVPSIRNATLEKAWPYDRAEQVFWVLFLAGFGLKGFRLWMGADVSGVAPNTLFANRTVAFFLSLNWLHWAAMAVINIAYQGTKARGDAVQQRLRALAYGVNVLVLGASLTTAGRVASVAPLASLLVIRQFYVPLSTGALLRRGTVLAVLLLMFKGLLGAYVQDDALVTDQDHPARYVFFYTLFNRVNMSWVLARVIEGGQQAYPGGTLGQFVVDMLPPGMERVSVFDGNEFGRELALIQEADTATGIAATNIGDLYINGGLAGIAAGMLLCGVAYRLLLSLCQTGRPASVLVYSLMWPLCLHGTESPITTLCATALKMFALCVTVHLAITMFGAEEPYPTAPFERSRGVA